MSIYVEILVRAPMDALWSRTQTPNNRLAINAPEPIAAGRPSANPTLTCAKAPRSTIPTTDARSARRKATCSQPRRAGVCRQDWGVVT
jgi:hypothetical protein